MTCPAIVVENLSKAYRIGLKESMHDTFTGAVTSLLRSPIRNWRRLSRLDTFRNNGDAEDIVWALKDVSFEVQNGEVLGIIGRNGAGKSTLLKILSRITEPTSGRVVIRGRVSSLLEVGTGFHPELSGRENIYMNGTILGMTKREIDRKLDVIINFSGVEKFLDTPVKRYSSGMRVRLAFAVAAHLEPEILIIDEVLAVGDVEFQKKCLGKMQDVARGGRTVLFVSHNMPAVGRLCTRGIVLVNGAVSHESATRSAVEYYLRTVRPQSSSTAEAWSEYLTSSRIRMTSVEIETAVADGMGVPFGNEMTVAIGYSAEGLQSDCRFRIKIYDSMDQLVANLMTEVAFGELPPLSGEGFIKCKIPHMLLLPGRYRISLASKQRNEIIQRVSDACQFDVIAAAGNGTGHLPRGGIFLLPSTWAVTNGSPACSLEESNGSKIFSA
jgi:lipopolysaccharide transport system ATP-binding protein